MKLFECVGGNQFKIVKPLIKEAFDPNHPWSFTTKHPGTQDTDIKTLPVTLDDLLSPNTEYLADNDPEGLKYIRQIKATAKIEAARKVPGFGPDFRKSSNPNDFMYEVVMSYAGEGGERWSMLFGVSADGKHIQVFAS